VFIFVSNFACVCENDDERKFKTNVLALFDVIFVLLGGESEFQIKIS